MQETINSQSMLKVGTVLRGIYRIDSYLSSGGFGNTYVATNIEFDERVAVKEFFMKGVTQRDGDHTTVSVSNAENQDSFLEQREKFKKEARRLRKLANPHIVSVHDLFEENGTAYYVMDYVDGENLAERLKRTGKPMTETEVNEILPQILDALKTVHDADIWHLDLKPANIMLDKNGQVRLIDFGASKQLHAQKGGATTSTAISYTNGYAPREQMEQNYDKFGPWTDLYALGATLYTLLTNKRPPLPTDIDDDTSEDKHLALPFLASVSESMKKRVLWLMSTNRMQRPQNVNEMLAKVTKNTFKDTTEISCNDEETLVALPNSDVGKAIKKEEEEVEEEIAADSGLFWFLPISIRIVITIIVVGGIGIFWDIIRFFIRSNFLYKVRQHFLENYPDIFGLSSHTIIILVEIGSFLVIVYASIFICSYWMPIFISNIIRRWYKNSAEIEIVKLKERRRRIATASWWMKVIFSILFIGLFSTLPFFYAGPMDVIRDFDSTIPSLRMGWTFFLITYGLSVSILWSFCDILLKINSIIHKQ